MVLIRLGGALIISIFMAILLVLPRFYSGPGRYPPIHDKRPSGSDVYLFVCWYTSSKRGGVLAQGCVAEFVLEDILLSAFCGR